jgi:UDPglucose 6-dehydrogenase
MNLSIIGTGYVGLVSGVCFASLGHHVICVDIDKEKVDNINRQIPPIFEKDLDKILNKYKDNIRATTSYAEAVDQSEVTFICVGTPSKEDGDIDLRYVDQATKAIGYELKNKESFHSVVVKSTVVPGTTRNYILPMLEKASGKKAGLDFGVGMNPEFLREGVAINDFLNPDRVVNGYYDEKTKEILGKLYKEFSCPVVETSLTVAEMIKYASNCFLATKISFINEIGNMCKYLGIDVYDVADGMGLDKRIERSFLNAGIGWGGSCFPKDTKALHAWAKKEHIPSHLTASVIKVNDEQPLQLIKILKRHLPDLHGKTIGLLGLAFKPDTDDIRDSRSIPLVESLLQQDVTILAYDPQAMDHFKKRFPQITYCSNPDEVLSSDAIIIATAWEIFKTLNYKDKIVIDGRRMLEVKNTASTYEGVGW